jgi:hypothetical protein
VQSANSRESHGQKLLFELTAVLAVLVLCLGCTLMVHETRLAVQSLAKGPSCACANSIPYPRDSTAAPTALLKVLRSAYREFPLSSEVSAVYCDLHNYALVIPLGRKLYTPIHGTGRPDWFPFFLLPLSPLTTRDLEAVNQL